MRKGKEYYEKINKAKECNFKPGDTVLLEENIENKLGSELDSAKYCIINRIGNTVTLKAPMGKAITRNVSLVNKFILCKPEAPEEVNIKTGELTLRQNQNLNEMFQTSQ